MKQHDDHLFQVKILLKKYFLYDHYVHLLKFLLYKDLLQLNVDHQNLIILLYHVHSNILYLHNLDEHLMFDLI